MSKLYKHINKLREIDNTFEITTAEDFINKEIKIDKELSKNKGVSVFPISSIGKFSLEELQNIANSKGYDFLPYSEYIAKYEKLDKYLDNSVPYSDSYFFCKKH